MAGVRLAASIWASSMRMRSFLACISTTSSGISVPPFATALARFFCSVRSLALDLLPDAGQQLLDQILGQELPPEQLRDHAVDLRDGLSQSSRRPP